RAMQRRLDTAQQQTDRIALRLTHPRKRLADSRAAMDALARRMQMAITAQTQSLANQSAHLGARLKALRPAPARYRPAIDALHSTLQRTLARQLAHRNAQLDALTAHLEHLNPEAVLSRGYSITRGEDGRILRDAAAAPVNSDVTVQLHRGHLSARVTQQRAAENTD
ncbi:MAG TPA: exodeoxyribonuclease VII large subunit, partial [Denitromonas sp.]|nr:exodeoxyribonuclease VII large subunit [Denitromonas sp.]